MSPFRPDRRQRGPDPYLGQKMLIFVLGAVLGIAGMMTNRAWLVYTAAAVLSVGVLLRFLPRRRGGSDAEDPHADDLHDDAPGEPDEHEPRTH